MKKLVLPLNIVFLGLSLAFDIALMITHLYPLKITGKRFLYACRCSKPDIRLEIFSGQETAVNYSDYRCVLCHVCGYSDKPELYRRRGIFALGHICYFIAYSVKQIIGIPISMAFIHCSSIDDFPSGEKVV